MIGRADCTAHPDTAQKVALYNDNIALDSDTMSRFISLDPPDVNGSGAVWSPDGKRLAYISNEFIQEYPALFCWKLKIFEGGEIHNVFTSDDTRQTSDATVGSPVWLPG